MNNGHTQKRSYETVSLFSSLLEMKDFVGGLPCRLNKIMDAITTMSWK